MTATFKTVSPGVLQMTIGKSYVMVWLKLTGTWQQEVAAYVNGINQAIHVQRAGNTMEGQFNSSDGAFTWVIQPGSWQITGTPTGGAGNTQKGTF